MDDLVNSYVILLPSLIMRVNVSVGFWCCPLRGCESIPQMPAKIRASA